MRVEVAPRSASIVPGYPTVLTVNVVNVGTVIGGYRIRVLGVDARWITVDRDELSLFPDTAGVAVVTVTLPAGIPAGVRRIAVEVRELTPPGETRVVPVELSVPAELGLRVELDPVSTTGGKSATVGVLIDNTGNSDVEISLMGADEEGLVRFVFSPAATTLVAGERTLATGHLRAKRPLVGSPKVRPYKVLVGPTQPPVGTVGTWVQKPLLSRGALALIGLLAAVSVFAAILTISLSRVVDKSTADRNLALEVANAGQAGAAGGGSGSIAGTVTLLTTATPVAGVTVEVVDAANAAQPLASTATNPAGAYQFGGLGVGTFKVRFRGAGFTELWYPDSLAPDNAKAVTLEAGQAVTGIDARLGGVPASVSGQVVGADPTGAVVSLELPAPPAGASSTVAPTGPAATSATTPAPAGATTFPTATAGAPAGAAAAEPAIVTTQTLDAGGAFTLNQIPSPSVYQLVVTKKGFATATQQVDLGSGEKRAGIVITLRQGDGSITGLVATAGGPLGGATISASDGHSTATTVSLTQGAVGTFVLTNLPTPASFTVTVSATGFATQTLTLMLAQAQQLTGVSVALATGTGSISGKATLADGSPATGVTVAVTNGQLSLQTVTLSVGAVGTYQVSGLPVPSTYTVTFSRADLASQTKAVSLDALAASTASNVNVTLLSATAVISGTVYESSPVTADPRCPAAGDKRPVGEVTIDLTSGANRYRVTSATAPNCGAYEIDNVQPGTYTISLTRPGGLPSSSILTLAAGGHQIYSPVLALAASISGIVDNTGGNAQQEAEVRLFTAGQFPTGHFLDALTDAAGHFAFNNLDAPQTYVLVFAFPQGSPGQFPTIELTLNLSEQRVLGGHCPPPPVPATTTTSTTGPPSTLPPTTPPPTTVPATTTTVVGTTIDGSCIEVTAGG